MDIQYKKLVVQLTSLSTVTGSFNGILASDVTTSRLDPDPILTKIYIPEQNYHPIYNVIGHRVL